MLFLGYTLSYFIIFQTLLAFKCSLNVLKQVATFWNKKNITKTLQKHFWYLTDILYKYIFCANIKERLLKTRQMWTNVILILLEEITLREHSENILRFTDTLFTAAREFNTADTWCLLTRRKTTKDVWCYIEPAALETEFDGVLLLLFWSLTACKPSKYEKDLYNF